MTTPTVIGIPKKFEECVSTYRMENCKFCTYVTRRGANWKQCKFRVTLFLREGGFIL